MVGIPVNVATRGWGEPRQHRSGQSGQLAGVLDAIRRQHLEPGEAGHRAVDRSAGREAQVPRVALEPLRAELEDRRPLTDPEPSEDLGVLAVQVRSRLALD
jgi:hypothetical protein